MVPKIFFLALDLYDQLPCTFDKIETDVKKMNCLIFFQLYLSALTCRTDMFLSRQFLSSYYITRDIVSKDFTAHELYLTIWYI